MKVVFPDGIVVEIESKLPFLGPDETHPVALKTPAGLVECPGKANGCCGLRQGDDGELYCGLTSDQQAAGDIARCYDEITKIIQEAPPQSAHPETHEG
ncbi:MAG: hypothetical protein AAB557_02955 [Patescibacteria group bacterium]